MLEAQIAAIWEVEATDQVDDHVSDQVSRMLEILAKGEYGSSELMDALMQTHRPTFR